MDYLERLAGGKITSLSSSSQDEEEAKVKLPDRIKLPKVEASGTPTLHEIPSGAALAKGGMSPAEPQVALPEEDILTKAEKEMPVNLERFDHSIWSKGLEMGGDMASWVAGAKAGQKLSAFTPGPVGKVLLPAIGAGLGYAFPGILKRALGLSKEEATPFKDVATGAAMDLGFGAIKPAAQTLGPLLKGPGEFIERNFSEPVLGQLKKLANWKVLPGSEEAMLHGEMTPFKMKKSLADVFQPAVERLSKRLSTAFRENTAIRSNAISEGEILGQKVAQLNPQARLEILSKGLNPASINDPEAKALVKTFTDQLPNWGLTQTQATEVVDTVGKNLSHFFTTPQGAMSNPQVVGPVMQAINNAMQVKNLGIKGRWNSLVEGPIQNGLTKLIDNPTASSDLKALARDLHDLPVILPLEVGKSVRRIMRTDLLQTLKGVKGVVLDTAPPAAQMKNYIPSKYFGVDPLTKSAKWVKRDVELELRAMEGVPKAAHQFMNKWFMSPWKTAKVILNPAANVRNDLTNIMQNHMDGLPFWDLKTYNNALASMKGKDLTGLYGKSGTLESFQRLTGVGGTFSMSDVAQMTHGMKYGAPMHERILAFHDKLVNPARSLYSAQETYFKYANYLKNLEGGMKPREAAQKAMDALFNYGEITRATANVRSNLMPFVTWQSKILPQMIEKVVRNPVKTAGLFYMYHAMQDHAINNLGLSEDEGQAFLKALPEYMRKGIMFPLPWRDEDGRVQMLDLTYLVPGIGDMFQMSNNFANNVLSNPLLGLSAMFINNRKFSGAPLWNEWDPIQTKIGKGLGATWESVMPSLMPGGLDWNRWYNSLQGTFSQVRRPTDLTLGQAAAAQSGFRVVPKDIGETFRKHEALGKIRKSEIEQSFAREFKGARSQDEIDALLVKYQGALEWLASEAQLSP